MRFPIIKVRDKDTGHEHIVGTNTHDQLEIDEETGAIHYLNLQIMESTRKFGGGKSTYEFVGAKKYREFGTFVEFVTFDELIEIYKQNIAMSCEQERNVRDLIKKIIAKEREKHKLDDDECDYFHTAGGHYRY